MRGWYKSGKLNVGEEQDPLKASLLNTQLAGFVPAVLAVMSICDLRAH